MKTRTEAETRLLEMEKEILLQDMNGSTGWEWMEMRFHFDSKNRTDLAEFCSEQAEEAYAYDDAEEDS